MALIFTLLSTSNAMLKVLEEPPGNTLFFSVPIMTKTYFNTKGTKF